jgi:hypothetical protein
MLLSSDWFLGIVQISFEIGKLDRIWSSASVAKPGIKLQSGNIQDLFKLDGIGYFHLFLVQCSLGLGVRMPPLTPGYATVCWLTRSL